MTNPKVEGILILDKDQKVVESTFDLESDKSKKFEEKCKTVIPNFTENARSTIRNLNPLVRLSENMTFKNTPERTLIHKDRVIEARIPHRSR